MKNDFLHKVTSIIEQNIANEQFGVSELADAMDMSRSNLLRKVKSLTGVSASRYIREIRLEKAMTMLRDSPLTVSEIAYKVGFGSPSYFIKCFRDHYGYPPGEVQERIDEEDAETEASGQAHRSHRLAAIMFTDIQGYTALMQQDEDKAIAFRNRHREVFETTTKKFGGKILQYYGDGTLSTFNSAIDAVKCGIEMQYAFREQQPIPVRIGIHTGDILFREDGIIGDGVNIASRIESLASAGSVLISEKVFDEVKNQKSIQCISLGVFELKNVGKPLEVFAVSNPGLEIPEKALTGEKAVKSDQSQKSGSKAGTRHPVLIWGFLFLVLTLAGWLIYRSLFQDQPERQEYTQDDGITLKSIAVLPFINDSNDSSNVYIINGLMEAILNNLQKIENLRVISRTSAEKYRNILKSSPEIARELNVGYLIEGSGQKIGEQIQLNIQLIDAKQDQHLWSQQYNRKTGDIFELQREIAKKIANEIEVFISPEEEQRIDKAPTNDLVAYDYFLQGLDFLNTLQIDQMAKSIPYFEKAIQQDPEFARAYAALTMVYYFLDQGKEVKEYSEKIEYYGDKALLLDAQLPQSLIAKALYFMHNKDYKAAVPYFEKALEYNPNSDVVFMFLVDLYANHLPDTQKYLEYALRGLEIDISAYDSTAASINYLHISNAFIQSGFVGEARKYINRSLDFLPENLYSQYVRAYITYAENLDLEEAKDLVLNALEQDSNRLDILQEAGKFHYFMRNYDSAYHYYKRFMDLMSVWNLDLYRSEYGKIAVVLQKVGLQKESEEKIELFREYAANDPSIYKNMNLAMYYAYQNDTENAIRHLRLFSKEEHYFYWVVLLADLDPLMDNLKDVPEYKRIMNDIEKKFWDWHEEIRTALEEKDLI